VANPLDRSQWESWHTRTDKAKERDRSSAQAIFDFNIGVAKGILMPFTPVMSLYQGEEPQKVVAQSGGSALATWLTIQALGGAEFGAVQVSRSVATRAATSLVTPALPVVTSVVVTDKYISFLEGHQPVESTHQPSFWNSVAAAIGGTFGGMGYE